MLLNCRSSKTDVFACSVLQQVCAGFTYLFFKIYKYIRT